MHVKYSEIISNIATSSWGSDFSTKEQAEKELLNDKQALGAFAAVELLRRLECLASSLRGKKAERNDPRVYTPDETAVFPDVKVGDRLFEYSLDEGISEFVVVAKNDENHCRNQDNVVCLEPLLSQSQAWPFQCVHRLPLRANITVATHS